MNWIKNNLTQVLR